MTNTEYLPFLLSNKYLLVFTALMISFLVSLRFYPVMILLVTRRRLMDVPGQRSMHATGTPTLGGIIVFLVFSIILITMALLLRLPQTDLLNLLGMLAGTILLLCAGVKDDLIGISPKKKLLIQLFAASVVVFLTDVRITNGYGVLGLHHLPYSISIVLTIFVFIVFINAFNLIDGIDGLAGSIGVLSCAALGGFFFMGDKTALLLVSFALIGALMGFLRYNLARKRKIFMGDSGSMFIGFLLVYQAISFLNYNSHPALGQSIPQAPILVIAILSFPLLDTLRVFLIRIAQKRSPFSADRNHIHHRLLDLGLTHKKVTLVISTLNIMVICISLLLGDLNINTQFIVLMIVLPLVYSSPWILTSKKWKNMYYRT